VDGFCYMANAAGRLLGKLLSGQSFQVGGLPLCLTTAGGMAMAALQLRPLDRATLRASKNPKTLVQQGLR
jgi:hypothetical protein